MEAMRGRRDYSRLQRTPFPPERMKELTVLVGGAGALGNEVIKNLALLGVGRLWIVDRDHVEVSNLTRSVLFCVPEIDQHCDRRTPKALFAAQRIGQINPEVETKPFTCEIADVGLGWMRRIDLAFSCFDNELARLELSRACLRTGKPLADGGLGLLNSSQGMVSIYPDAVGPCYACRMTPDARCRLLDELWARPAPCREEGRAQGRQEGAPTTPMMASVVAAIQVELGLRHVLSEEEGGDPQGRACRIQLAPQRRLDDFIFERDSRCPLHGEAIERVRELPKARSDRCSPADLLAQFGSPRAALRLDWPMVTQARCRRCGHRLQGLRLRRSVLRTKPCPSCRERDWRETQTLERLRDSEIARLPLSQLGLPLGHIHEIALEDRADSNVMHVEMTGDLEASGFRTPFTRGAAADA